MKKHRVLARAKLGIAFNDIWYEVVESLNGELFWGDAEEAETVGASGSVAIDRVNHMSYTPVTPEEAILVTGIDHPMAAMDRLREFVHEAVET